MGSILKFLKGAIIFLIIAAITAMVVEIAGQKIVAKPLIKVMGDPDHRMEPFSEEDINEDGIRFSGTSSDVSTSHNVIFLGDSYTYGWGLDYNETIPVQFEQAHNLQQDKNITAINFGWTSSSPLLSYRLLKDIGKKYKPETVFLLFDMTDFWDDNLYSIMLGNTLTAFGGKVLPATTISIYHSIQSIPFLYEWIYGQPVNRYFHAHRPLAESTHLFASSLQYINDIADYSRNILNANFVLVILPRHFQYSDKEAPESKQRPLPDLGYTDLNPYAEEPFRFFEAYQKDVDFPVILLLEDFKNSGIFPTTFKHDGHYNADGARFAANRILQKCLKIDCLNQKSVSEQR